jgi:hypothetical protein
MNLAATTSARAFELHFTFLFDSGRGLAFPCDADGHVDTGALSERARVNYLRAMDMIGRDYATPCVLPTLHH